MSKTPKSKSARKLAPKALKRIKGGSKSEPIYFTVKLDNPLAPQSPTLRQP